MFKNLVLWSYEFETSKMLAIKMLDYDSMTKLKVYVCSNSLDMVKSWNSWYKITCKWLTSRLWSGFDKRMKLMV